MESLYEELRTSWQHCSCNTETTNIILMFICSLVYLIIFLNIFGYIELNKKIIVNKMERLRKDPVVVYCKIHQAFFRRLRKTIKILGDQGLDFDTEQSSIVLSVFSPLCCLPISFIVSTWCLLDHMWYNA
jgi:hypothetical protein